MTTEHRVPPPGIPPPGPPYPPGAGFPAGPGDAPTEGRPGAKPATPSPSDLRRGRGRVFGLGVSQLVVCELAVVAALLAAARSVWLLSAAVPLAIAAIVLALGRWHGRWLYEELVVRGDFRRRAGLPPAPQTDDTRLAMLRELQPGMRVTEVADRSGARVGLVGDGRYWSALLVLEAAEADSDEAVEGFALPLEIVADALRTRDVRLAAIQILTHTVPAPTASLPPDAPCTRSYRGLSTEAVPARRSTWIVLRLDPQRCPAAVDARGGGAVGAQRALSGTVTRLATSLQLAGVDVRTLPAEEVIGVLSITAGATAWGNAGGGRRSVEAWDSWAVDDTIQACFWVRRWPRLARVGEKGLLARLGEVRGVFNAVSVVLTGEGPRGVSLRAMVRVVGNSRQELEGIVAELHHAADEATLVRLDGEHLPAVLETLPLGGART